MCRRGPLTMNYKRLKINKQSMGILVIQLFWFALALISGASFFYFVSYAWLLLILSSFWIHKTNTSKIISQFEIEKNELSAGQSIGIRYRVVNNSLLPAFNVKIYPIISKSFGYEQFDSDRHGFDSYEAKVIDRSLVCQRRGFYTLGEVAFEISDPLGMMTSHFSKTKPIEIVVRPRVFPVSEDMPRPLEHYGTRGMSLRQLSDRSSIKSVRPYKEGDQIRDIHWKLTAKTGKLSIKEYTQSVSHKIYLFIDGCQSQYEALPHLADEAMDLAASLTYQWLSRGVPVQVIFSDESRTTFSGRNLGGFGKAMDFYTAFSPNGIIEFEDFLEKELRFIKDGAKWVSISPAASEKIRTLLIRSRSGQFEWTYYALTEEGRVLI